MKPGDLPARTEGGFHVVVESPRGSRLKLAYHPELGAIALKRPLPLGFAYPFDWGFVPGTLAPDGDPVDALVLWDEASWPGVVLPCRALGVLNIEQRSAGASDRRVRNDRLVVTPLVNPREAARSIHDIPERVHRELEHFFTSAVFFEPKDPRVLGWGGPLDADALLREGEKAYAKR